MLSFGLYCITHNDNVPVTILEKKNRPKKMSVYKKVKRIAITVKISYTNMNIEYFVVSYVMSRLLILLLQLLIQLINFKNFLSKCFLTPKFQ